MEKDSELDLLKIYINTDDKDIIDIINSILFNETIDNISLVKSLNTRYNEGNQDDNSDDEEFDYDKVIKHLKQRQRQKKPVNIRDKQEKANFENSIKTFTQDELNDGCAVRYTSKYEYSLEVYSDSTYTIIHRKRLY